MGSSGFGTHTPGHTHPRTRSRRSQKTMANYGCLEVIGNQFLANVMIIFYHPALTYSTRATPTPTPTRFQYVHVFLCAT